MALDKCYIDLKNDSIIAPAVRYYSRHGSADDRLKMYYYKGRLAENASNNEEAMRWLAIGEKYASRCIDYVAVGRLYSVMGAQYYYQYHCSAAIEKEYQALAYYEKAGATDRQIISKLNLIYDYLATFDPSPADTLISSLKPQLPLMTKGQKIRWCRCSLKSSLHHTERLSESLDLIYRYVVSPSDYPSIDMARAYIALENPDSAFYYLNRVQVSDTFKVEDPAYYMAYSEALSLVGDYRSAFENERMFNVLEMNDLYRRMQSEVSFVEERTKNEYESKLLKQRSVSMILALVIALISVIAVFLATLRRLKKKRTESERLQKMYDSVYAEIDSLKHLSENSRFASEKMSGLVRERIGKLEKILLMRKANSHVRKDIAMVEFDNLIADKRSFLLTMSFLYTLSHPKFVEVLRGKNLSETETGYCCLYMMGLETKEVAELLETKSAYNTNASIRKKLGLMDSKQTLPDYLKQLEL